MAWEETYCDDVTGLPLPILPSDTLGRPNPHDDANWHHHFHPRHSPLLQDIAGQAVRYSRVQWLDFDRHTEYHQHFEGPPLPDSPADQLLTVVMANAGYIPGEAIDVTYGMPRRVTLQKDEILYMKGNGMLKTVNADMTRRFLTETVLQQPLDHVDSAKIEEFLDLETPDDRRWFLGNWVLSQAVEVATEPIKTIYQQAWKEELIDQTLPAKPETFYTKRLGYGKRRREIILQLKDRLAS